MVVELQYFEYFEYFEYFDFGVARAQGGPPRYNGCTRLCTDPTLSRVSILYGGLA